MGRRGFAIISCKGKPGPTPREFWPVLLLNTSRFALPENQNKKSIEVDEDGFSGFITSSGQPGSREGVTGFLFSAEIRFKEGDRTICIDFVASERALARGRAIIRSEQERGKAWDVHGETLPHGKLDPLGQLCEFIRCPTQRAC